MCFSAWSMQMLVSAVKVLTVIIMEYTNEELTN